MSESQGALKIGVLISGSGSNLQAIIDRIDQGTLDAEIVLVISSRPDAFGLARAEKAGIPTLALNREVYQDAPAANKRIADALKEAGAEYVIMAGYMRKLTNEVLDAYPDRVVNLHPALLPSFKGAHAIEDAFNFGVHFANEDYDKGPIIAQRAVEVREDDTLDSLEEHIHEAEHALYPEVISWLAAGRVQIDEETRTVHISAK